MIYNPKIATVTHAEFVELASIMASAPDQPRPLDEDDRWRRAYQLEQEQRRIVVYQHDLFAPKTVTHYHRHQSAPPWDRTSQETIEAKLERIAGDPLANFGPPRSDRPTHLTKQEPTAIVAKAANWLRVRQRVRLIDAPGYVDPAYGIHRFPGQTGVVWRLCRCFEDHCYVFFDPVGGERTAKIEFVELRDLEPLR